MRQLSFIPLCFLACVSDPGTGGKGTGDEGGPCFENGTCKSGLMCVVPNMCVKADASTTMMDGAGNTDSMSNMDGSPGDGTTMMEGAADSGPCIGGVIAHWEFEGNGTAKMGGITLTDPTTALTYGGGVKGKGATLNPGYLTATTSAFGNLTNLTVELWVKRTGVAATQRMFYYAANGGGGSTWWNAYLDQNYGVVWTAGNGTITSMPIPADGNFHHVAMVFVGGNTGSVSVWVDGNSISTNTNGMIGSGNGDKLFVGADANGTGNFGGTFDELAIYNRALDMNEIKAIVSAGPNGICRTP